MPVTPAIAESNRAQTERLRALAQRLTPAMLAVRLSNGWTVAVALAHIAFWDRQRLCLLRRWGTGDWCNGGYDGELFKEVLLPFLGLLPPDRVASLTVETDARGDEVLIDATGELLRDRLGGTHTPTT